MRARLFLRVSRSPAAAAGAGACGGVLGGLFNLGGPPVILYCASALDGREPYKEIYMATTQAYFVITTSYGVAVRALNALMPEQVLLWSAAGLAGSLCGSMLGRVLYRRIPERLIKKWIYLVIGGSGLWMLARSIWTS